MQINGNLILGGSEGGNVRGTTGIAMQSGTSGVITGYATSSTNRKYLGLINDTILQVGGISNKLAITTAGAASKNSTLILTNKSDFTTSGEVREAYYSYCLSTVFNDGASGAAANENKLKIVHNGTGTQEFTTSILAFTGGINVKQGELKLNFAATNNTSDIGDRYANITKLTTYVVEGTNTTISLSHGLLEMEGGTFSSTETDYGSFRLSGIKYKDGTISLKLSSTEQFDSLDLTAQTITKTLSVQKLSTTDASPVGDPTITTTTITELGGTLVREGSNKVTFDFGTSLEWLINSELNDKKGVKIIAWESESELGESDFTANSFQYAETEYTAKFAQDADGLYVKYVAVPEPAEWAAIFGVLALAFAAYRRRK